MNRPRKSTRKHWPGKLLNCNRWIINREKLIALAQKAGFTIEAGKAQGTIIVEGDGGLCETTLGAFAELVSAAEREMCAKLCEKISAEWAERFPINADRYVPSDGINVCAASIREMSTNSPQD